MGRYKVPHCARVNKYTMWAAPRHPSGGEELYAMGVPSAHEMVLRRLGPVLAQGGVDTPGSSLTFLLRGSTSSLLGTGLMAGLGTAFPSGLSRSGLLAHGISTVS